MPILRLRILPPFPSVHFSRIIVRIFSPPYWGSRRGLLSFFISVAYLRQFPFRPIPFLSPPSLLSFGISLFVSAKLGGLEMPLPLRPVPFALFFFLFPCVASFFFYRTIVSSALFSPFPPFPSVHFSRIIARILSPP